MKTFATAVPAVLLLSAGLILADSGPALADSGAPSPASPRLFIDYFLPTPPHGNLTWETWGATNVLPRDVQNGLEDPTIKKYCYWDGQIIKAADGKYHMFASRWDESRGHNGWFGSVAVHAVSDSLTGPYTDKGLCWPDEADGRGHNVTALTLPDGRYAIVISETRPCEVYVSPSLDGPWEHLGTITVEGDPQWHASNVSIMARPDGNFEFTERSGRIFFSDKGILGPYKQAANGVFPGGIPNLEDPCIWYSGGFYHIVVNSWSTRKAYHLTSRDGISDWTNRGVAYDPREAMVRYPDGTVNHWSKAERPSVYIENGHVAAMTFAVIDVEKEQDKGGDGHGSKVIVVPFDGAALDRDLQSTTGLSRIPYATEQVIEAGDSDVVIAEKAAKVLPRANQTDWMRLEWTFFLHYGPNAFHNVEWGSGREEPSLFNPSDFDADQWVSAMAKAGGKMIVLVCKHHDGLCLWQTRYTAHSVAASPWLDGKGDVVRAVADAARKYGLKLGVYLSPADLYQLRTNPKNPGGYYGDGSSNTLSVIPTDPATFKTDPTKGRVPPTGFTNYTYAVDNYNRYFLNQLYELLTEYGPVQEVWFDGANPDPSVQETYDYNAWYDLIRRLQPGAVIMGKGPDVRWVGNEGGFGRTTEWSVIPLPTSPENFRWPDMTAGDLGSREKLKPGSHLWWYPAEINVTILANGAWFWAPQKHPRSLSEMVDIYYRAIGRNGNFLLNLSPDSRGRIPDDQLQTLSKMSEVVKDTFATNLALGGKLAADSFNSNREPSLALDGNLDTWWEAAPGRITAALTLTLPKPVTFDVISLQEAVDHRGQRIESFAIDYNNGSGWSVAEKIASDELTTVGHRRLIRLKSSVTTDQVRIRVTGSRLEPTLAELGLFKQSVYGMSPVISDRSADNLITITNTGGCRMVFTLDGTEPTTLSTLYESPIKLPLTGTVKAACVMPNGQLGIVASKSFAGMPSTHWKIIAVDSQETSGDDNAAARAIDGNSSTFWHTRWNGDLTLPHFITVDMGVARRIGGFTYLPRQDGNPNGTVERYRFETSADGTNWITNVVSGTFANIRNNPSLQEVHFAPVNARYFRFTALQEINRNGWTSAAEISVLPASRDDAASASGDERRVFRADTGELFGGASKSIGNTAARGYMVSLTQPGEGVRFTGLSAASKLAIQYGAVTNGTISVRVNDQLVSKVNVHSSGALTNSVLQAILDLAIPANATLAISMATNDVAVNMDQLIVGNGDLGLPPDIWNLPQLPVAAGPYSADWKAISRLYTVPEWWRDAKFGAWAHWDPQSMPEAGDWYARGMYQEGSPQYRHHTNHFGHPAEYGYKDICHNWVIDRWNPNELMDLYVEMGARYFMAMGAHHDNFDCFDSKYQPWNSVNLGPKVDIVGTWEKAARAHGLPFGIGFHSSPGRTWGQFMPVRYTSDQRGPMSGVPYDALQTILDGKGKWWQGLDPVDLYGPPHFLEGGPRHPANDSLLSPFANQFMWRVDDAVTKYHPDVIYFDEHAGDSQMDLGVHMGLGFLGPRLAANYYNKSLQWNHGKMAVVLNLKGVGGHYNSFQNSPELLPLVDRSLVKSTEAIIEPEIMAYSFQTETTIADWHYHSGQQYMEAREIVSLLMQNICRNGTLLLNLTQHGRGNLDPQVVQIAKDVGAWLKVNGEAVYASRPFEVCEENKNAICYTRNNGNVYAAVMNWTNGTITLKALRAGGATLGRVAKVEMLGSDVPMTFTQNEQGLTVTPGGMVQPLPGIMNQSLAAGCRVLRITHDKGWINDDDPNTSYPGWMRRCNLGTGDFNNDLTISETPGDIWSSSFTGSSVSIIAPKETGAGTFEVQIDGQTRATVDLSTDGVRQPQQTVCEVTGLSFGQHAIAIVHRGPGPVAVDALVVR